MSKTFEELKSWVRFGDDDVRRLTSALPAVEPHLPRIIDIFYGEIQRHPGSNDVLDGPAQVERLKGSLIVWLREVFQGPHDAAYALRRQRIGERHVEVGLPDRYMFTAMHLIQSEVCHVLREGGDEWWRTGESFRKVCSIDLALMTGTYVQNREIRQFNSLQDLLVEHLRLAVLLVDHDGIVRTATQASARLISGRQVVGHGWQSALPAGLLEASGLPVHVARALERRRDITLPRVDVTTDDGQRSFRIHVLPLRHEMAQFLIQIEELTETLAMETRVRRSEALAQLGALSAAVAHELRNPLAGISGALQVITRAMDEGDRHRPILAKVESEVRRLNGLVTDLLAFARPGSAILEPVNLREVADEVVGMLVPRSRPAAIEVTGEGQGNADPNLLRQVLHNLLRNAVDAAGVDGAIKVLIAPGNVRVMDSGPGVPVDQRDRIFEPFVTTKTKGTGLGLAISLRAADAMGGTLELCEGTLGGAAFRLSLSP